MGLVIRRSLVRIPVGALHGSLRHQCVNVAIIVKCFERSVDGKSNKKKKQDQNQIVNVNDIFKVV